MCLFTRCSSILFRNATTNIYMCTQKKKIMLVLHTQKKKKIIHKVGEKYNMKI